MVLDREHLAVGTQAALKSFYQEKPVASEQAPRYTRAVLFGHLKVGPRLAALVPPAIEAPAGIDLVGSEDGRLAAVLVCRDPQKAQDLQMFLEGVRSLLLLEQEQHLALTSLLKGISIAQESSQVTVASALFPLLDLWVQPPGEEAPPAQEGTSQQPPPEKQ